MIQNKKPFAVALDLSPQPAHAYMASGCNGNLALVSHTAEASCNDPEQKDCARRDLRNCTNKRPTLLFAFVSSMAKVSNPR